MKIKIGKYCDVAKTMVFNLLGGSYRPLEYDYCHGPLPQKANIPQRACQYFQVVQRSFEAFLWTLGLEILL